MIDVFLSYKREDQVRVAPIIEGLRAAGLSVWWDRDIGSGESWRQSIAQALEEAKCVIVVWSAVSAGPLGDFVRDEAGRAKARGVLLPVRIDAVREPVGFGEVQSLDLVGWLGNPKDRRFARVVETAKALVAGGPRPRPRTLGPWGRLVARWGAVFVLLAAVLGFATNLAGLQKPLCKVPGVRALCDVLGLGGVPTREEEALWKARKPGDCTALYAYLEHYSKGVYAEEARRRLQVSDLVSEERWTPLEQRRPLTVRSNVEPLPNEQVAKKDALARAEPEAQQICEPLTVGGTHRIKGVQIEARTWRCLDRVGGSACGFEGQAICQVEAREIVTREVCP